MKFYENVGDKRILSRMEYFYKTDDNIKNIINSHLKPTINMIIDENVNLFKDKINWKLPGAGAFKPHQDFEAWSDFPPQTFLTAAIFVDNSTVKNGCLQMVQGKHTEGLFENNKGCLETDFVENNKWVNVLAQKSDLVLFDSYTPHRSDINFSDQTRRVFYFTFNLQKEGDHYEEYFSKKRQLFPPDYERNNTTLIDNDKNYKYNLANPMS